MLILFHETMWGHPVELLGAPDGVELTTDRSRIEQADAVVFHIPEWSRHAPQKMPGQLWVAWSMECEEHYPLLKSPAFMSQFDLTTTYRLSSDVPTPYVDQPVSEIVQGFARPASIKTETAPLACFISSKYNLSGRQTYLQELAKHITIDSYGKFLNTRKLDADNGRDSKIATSRAYRFTIAFENACSEDYVTEKFFDPFWAGSVPVYLGAPNVADFAPGEHCYIDAIDYSPRELADYLNTLVADEEAYSAYFAWKNRPFRPAFVKLLQRTERPWLERLCAAIRHRRPGAICDRHPSSA